MKRHWLKRKWNKLRDIFNGKRRKLRQELRTAGDYRDGDWCDRIAAQAWDRYGEYW